jgi:tetratricopeptide (TPR) repeat protein
VKAGVLVRFGGALLLALGLAAGVAAGAPERSHRSPLSDAITEIDLDRARQLLESARGDATFLALERARLAIYTGQCDAAAAELSLPTLAESPAGAGLAALAGSCARATAAGLVVEDRERGIWVRLQDDADRPLVPFLAATAAKARDVIGAELGLDLPRPLRIDVVRDLFSLAAVSGLPLEAAETTGTLAVARWGRVIVLSPRATELGFPWQDTVAHEITHLLVTRATTDHAPLWLQEGIAKREEARWRAARPFDDPSWADQTARTALLAGRSVGLDRLGPSIAMLPSPELASTAYAEVASFLTYFLAESGPPALRLLFADIRGLRADNADPALRSVSGYDISGWGRRWQTALRDVPALDPREERDRIETFKNPRTLARKVRLGDLLVERGYPRAALSEFRAALDLAPTHAGVRARAARAALALRDRPAAEAALGTLRDIRAPHGAWMALRGRFDKEAGNTAEAIATLDHALGLDPLNVDVACEGELDSPDFEKTDPPTLEPQKLPLDPDRRALCEAVRKAPKAPH